jgi:hypothetical protein
MPVRNALHMLLQQFVTHLEVPKLNAALKRAGPDPQRTIDKPNDIPKKTHIYLKIRIFRISTASSNPTPSPTYCPILPI